MKDFIILVPSYKPDEHLKQVVLDMLDAGFSRFVVVDDGGGETYKPFFDEVGALEGVFVLRHEINRGKGAAIKTGLSYIRDTFSDASFVLTVDADGQHRPKDVLKVAERAKEVPGAMVLGSRNFTLPQVPPRSRFGNRLTSAVFRLFCGAKIGDTQTGLRAIPVSGIERMLAIKGERYEYETNVLLYLKEMQIPLYEVEIETVYIDDNSASHFNPIRDSIRIYALILRFWGRSVVRVLKFSASSLLCTALDIGLFALLMSFFSQTLGVFAEATCHVAARLVSSILNFNLNRNIVFVRKRGKTSSLLLRYYSLALPQLVLSAGILTGITILFGVDSTSGSTLIKACVDLVLFFISYRFQRDWVFGKELGGEKKEVEF